MTHGYAGLLGALVGAVAMLGAVLASGSTVPGCNAPYPAPLPEEPPVQAVWTPLDSHTSSMFDPMTRAVCYRFQVGPGSPVGLSCVLLPSYDPGDESASCPRCPGDTGP